MSIHKGICAMACMIALLAAAPLEGTVVPHFKHILEWSDLVVVGHVLSVTRAVESSWVVTIGMEELLKGRLREEPPTISFYYDATRPEEPFAHQFTPIKFDRYQEEGATILAYLRYEPVDSVAAGSFQLQLTCRRFAFQAATADRTREIRRVESAVSVVYEVPRIAGKNMVHEDWVPR